MSSPSMIRDIQEKEISEPSPPSFPQPTSSTTGFPEHKKRDRASAFKRRRAGQGEQPVPTSASPHTVPSATARPQDGTAQRENETFEQTEKRRIDEENRAKMDAMSPEEIAKAQRELLTGLDPRIVQMLLRRANLDEPTSGPSPFDVGAGATEETPATEGKTEGQSRMPQSKSEADEGERQFSAPTEVPEAAETSRAESKNKAAQKERHAHFDEDTAPPTIPPDLFPMTSGPPAAQSKPAIHFPSPPPVPDLDPSDPNFLTNLHAKYFPTLPADPSKLAWMAPLPAPDSAEDLASPYHPSRAAATTTSPPSTSSPNDADPDAGAGLDPGQLRFDFRGRLLPPRLSRALPAHLGLHHHGAAPEAAGYTVGELAWLARSAVAAQRCIAFQTLGRVAYRLGQGEWSVQAAADGADGADAAAAAAAAGEEDDESLARAIWGTFEEGRVVETLMEAASVPEGQGHRGSRAYAMEALWLLEKSGLKERLLGK